MTFPTEAELAALFPDLELQHQLSSSGMSQIWVAQERSLGRWVALKLLPQEATQDAELLERMRTEALLVAQLANTGMVIQIYHFSDGLSGDWPHLLLEYASGGSLADWAKQATPPPQDVLSLGEGLAAGLALIHAQGVIHGDIKPDNLFVCGNGDVKYGDFGLAGYFPEAHAIYHTPGYTAPEILAGNTQLTPSTDVYALGATLLELASPGILMEAPAEHLATLALLPRPLARAITRAMQEAPTARLATAAALAGELRARPASQPVPRPHPPSLPSAPPQRRHGHALRWILGAVALAVCGALAFLAMENAKAPRQKADQREIKPGSESASAPPSAQPTLAAVPPVKEDTLTPDLEEVFEAANQETETEVKPGPSGSTTTPTYTFHTAETLKAWNREWTVDAPIYPTRDGARVSNTDDGESKVLNLHAHSLTQPARVWREIDLPADQPMALTLRAAASRLTQADWLLSIKCDGAFLVTQERIYHTLPGGRFREFILPLTAWKGKHVTLEVLVERGGHSSNYYEYAYLSDLAVIPLPDRIPQTPMEALLLEASTETAPPGWTDLFSAEHIAKWKSTGPGGLYFKDGSGVLWNHYSNKRICMAYYPQEFGNYELQFEFRQVSPEVDTGLYVRAEPPLVGVMSQDPPIGIEAELLFKTKSGAICQMGSLNQIPANNAAAYRVGEWQQMVVKATGKKVEVALNGQPVSAWEGGTRDRGVIGIQVSNYSSNTFGSMAFRRFWLKPAADDAAALASGHTPETFTPLVPPPAGNAVAELMHRRLGDMRAFRLSLVAKYFADLRKKQTEPEEAIQSRFRRQFDAKATEFLKWAKLTAVRDSFSLENYLQEAEAASQSPEPLAAQTPTTTSTQ